MFVSIEVDSSRVYRDFKATALLHVRLEDIFLREDYPEKLTAGQYVLLFRTKDWVYTISEDAYHKLKRLLAIDLGVAA